MIKSVSLNCFTMIFWDMWKISWLNLTLESLEPGFWGFAQLIPQVNRCSWLSPPQHRSVLDGGEKTHPGP